MSASPVVFVNIHNTLKRRAERAPGISVEEMLRAANEVIEAHRANGQQRLRDAVLEARTAINQANMAVDRGALMQKLTKLAAETEEHGRILGNALLAEIGVRLAGFLALLVKAVDGAQSKAVAALGLHLDAMIVALDGPQMNDVDEAGWTLLRNLELTRSTIKPA